jgi:uncharacterized protein
MGRAEAEDSRRGHLGELLAFLFLIGPAIIIVFLLLRPAEITFVSIAVHTILVNLALLGAVVALVRRRGEPVAVLGLGTAGFWRELQWGLLLFIPFLLGAALIETIARGAGLEGIDGPPAFLIPVGAGEILLALVFLTVVAVSEETVFRGYLIHRLRLVSGSAAFAVVFSSAVFAVGHGYQGAAGLATVGVMGVALALIYLWRQSLIAPIVIHFLQNFVGILIAPLLAP